MAVRTTEFQTIRSEGGLLPPDLLRRVLDPKQKLAGTAPSDYGLPEGERLNEVITQSWNRLRKHWQEFRSAAAKLPPTEPGTSLTNEKWTLPLLRELGYGQLPTAAGPVVDGRTYAISRFLGPVPIHLVGCGVSLDRRAAGVRGAAASNPHGLVQEFLNRSSGHSWAVLSNGLRLRLLRDNQALSRQSFLDLDLEAMFEGDVYSDFVLLWLVVHATRMVPREDDLSDTCFLEQWTKLANEQGTRALGDLRGGVERALEILGQGLTSHPKNTGLREALRNGAVTLADFHGQLLREVYRLIFLFVAEDRAIDGVPLLHPRDGSERARQGRERYAAHYGTVRLRELAAKIKGSRHGDQWRQLQIVVRALSGDSEAAAARDHLALPILGSFLWDPASTAALNEAELANHDFLEVVRNLAFARQTKILRPVDYRNLGAEELGGVYESLLALTPQISADGAQFNFAEFTGNERRTSGSYYTPDSLVQCLLDSALDPVVEAAVKGKTGAEAEKVILGLKVCDPAVGSGHFLVGAAHRLARHLSRVRAQAQGEGEPSPLFYQQALRDVIGHCLYGVDINPMAAELCRVSLWLEALEPGKPLSFLDHHIRVGNSLLGATPELVAEGIPDGAYEPIEGDDRDACTILRRLNRKERESLKDLFQSEDAAIRERLRKAALALDDMGDNNPEEIRAKAEAFRRAESDSSYQIARRLADLWCAAFVIKKDFVDLGISSRAVTSQVENDAPQPMQAGMFHGAVTSVPRADDHRPQSRARAKAEAPVSITTRHLRDHRALPDYLAANVETLAQQHQFFHWHLAFPEVFSNTGFACVLGNPPWEMVQIQEIDFFETVPEIARHRTRAARERAISSLKTSQPDLFRRWEEHCRFVAGQRHFMANSGRYKLGILGRINSYKVMLEAGWSMISTTGRLGMIVPSGIAFDDFSAAFFAAMTSTESLAALFDFENREALFPDVHRSAKFCLLTLCGQRTSEPSEYAFFLRGTDELADPDRRFTLSGDEIALLNPNSRTCPIFTRRRDATLCKHIYHLFPILVRESENEDAKTWNAQFGRIFNLGHEGDKFTSTERIHSEPMTTTTFLPLYEGKMFDAFNHRAASVRYVPTNSVRPFQAVDTDAEALNDPSYSISSQFYLEAETLADRLKPQWDAPWIIAAKDVTAATNERTVIAAVLPLVPTSYSVRVLLGNRPDGPTACAFVGTLNSFVFDWVIRQFLGGLHLQDSITKQAPVVPLPKLNSPSRWDTREVVADWMGRRILELTYASWDMEPFARHCGWYGPPFRWNEERRFLLQCELNAAFFHTYLPAEKNGEWRSAESEPPIDSAQLKASFPTPRAAVGYIMDTFPIVRRKDEERYQEYRTKGVVLDIYDAMQESIRTGQPYQTRLDPPPADPRGCHPARGAASVET